MLWHCRWNLCALTDGKTEKEYGRSLSPVLHSEKTYLTFGNTSEIIKHSLAARVSYISLVFSNSLRVLSQCNTRLRFLTNSGSNKVFNDVYNKLFSCKACLVVGDACFPRVYGPDKNLNHEKRIQLSDFWFICPVIRYMLQHIKKESTRSSSNHERKKHFVPRLFTSFRKAVCVNVKYLFKSKTFLTTPNVENKFPCNTRELSACERKLIMTYNFFLYNFS